MINGLTCTWNQSQKDMKITYKPAILKSPCRLQFEGNLAACSTLAERWH